MKRRWTLAVAALLVVAAASAEVVDSCSSLLGSIGVELRYARNLPRDARTTFACPRDTRALIGASRQRVLTALGTPDETVPAEDGAGQAWSYWFGPRPGADEARSPGQPGLRFDFDGEFAVRSVSCLRHP